jgi:hypothetical protein
MTNHCKLLLTPHAARPLVASRQLPVQVLAVLGLLLFPNSVAGICLPAPTQSETPLERSKPLGEAAIQVQSRARVGQCPPRPALRMAVYRGESWVIVTSFAPRSGHRLHNYLLAPMRC